ncbi:hypothetical protein PT2222_30148 [Paraburkholderia tropica]
MKPPTPVISARGARVSSERVMSFVAGEVGRDHHLAELLQRRLRLPAELGARLVRAADQQIDFGGTIETRTHAHERAAVRNVDAGFALAAARPFELKAGRREGHRHEVAHGFGAARREHVGVGFVGLQHAPHAFDVFGGVTPVALGVEIAEFEHALFAELDLRDGVRDLARHEFAAAQRRFVIEENAAGREDVIGLAVIHGRPVREQLGDAIRAARIEGRILALRHGLNLAEHFGRRRLVVARARIHHANRFEQIERADAGDFGGRDRLIERHAHEALRREIVDLARLRAFEQTHGRARIGEIVLDEFERRMIGDAEFVHAPEIDRTGAPVSADHLIALVEQQFGQIRAVLAGYAGDDRFASFVHVCTFEVANVETETAFQDCELDVLTPRTVALAPTGVERRDGPRVRRFSNRNQLALA